MPVPKFHTTFEDPHSTRQFIVMEYIDGMTLEEALPALSSQEKAAILMQIRSILHDLRSLPDPGYLGSVNRLPYEDGVFYHRDSPNPISGPFFSQVEFYTAIVGRFEKSEPAPFVRLVRKLTEKMPHHKVVYTHGDLQPRNIMLQKTHTADGVQKYKITLIDFEISGWYPAYWEFCNATIAGRFKPDWLDIMQDMFSATAFEYEILFMEFIRHLIFY